MNLRSALLLHDRLFIGGGWVLPEGATSLDVISPSTEEVIGQVPLGSSRDIERAVAAARLAFDEGPWPRMTMDERRTVLRRVARRLEGEADELDRLVSSENGTTLRTHQGHIFGRVDYYSDLDTIGLVGRRTSKDDLSVVA
jgi:aldehyde dehydrogenase (NAD+)